MKKLFLALSLLTLGWCTNAQAQLITNFSSTGTNPVLTSDLQGSWVGKGTQGSSFTITAAASDSAGSTNGLFTTLGTPVNISTNVSRLQLTGVLNSATPTTNSFTISLFDSSLNEADYTFHWSSFAGGPVSIVGTLGANSGFNGTVSSFLIVPGGAIGDVSTIGFTFDSLMAVAVPEPSTYALMALGLGVVGFGAYRRQKKSVAVRI